MFKLVKNNEYNNLIDIKNNKYNETKKFIKL